LRSRISFAFYAAVAFVAAMDSERRDPQQRQRSRATLPRRIAIATLVRAESHARVFRIAPCGRIAPADSQFALVRVTSTVDGGRWTVDRGGVADGAVR